MRNNWKEKPENKGKIYSKGFFQLLQAHQLFWRFAMGIGLRTDYKKWLVDNNSGISILLFCVLQCTETRQAFKGEIRESI